MAPMPGRVLLQGGPAAVAPCRHSKDRPAPWSRGRISCAEGDSGPPRDGREPSWARPCEASGALFLSNGGTGGGHAACTLWPPPAPFGYFPARGKYLVRPQAGETSHKKQISCERQETGLPFFLPYHKGFRLCGGDQGAFRSPPGPLRGPSLYTWTKPPTRNRFLVEGRKRAYLSFPVSQRVSPLRRRPGGLSGRPLDSFGGAKALP